jgi:hypothetical protein
MKTPATLLLVFFLLYNYSCSTKTENYDMSDKIKTELAAIDSLLRDTDYNALMAQTLEAAYYIGTEQPVMPFPSPGEDTAMKEKTGKRRQDRYQYCRILCAGMRHRTAFFPNQ